MSFMFAAGVRISTREGLLSLPDEVVVMMCNWEPVRVVNISDKNTWVNELSDVARIMEYGFFPRHDVSCVPLHIVIESTPSPKSKKRMEREARLEALMPRPSCVERPDYPWPTKILRRPRLDNARVQFVKSDPVMKRWSGGQLGRKCGYQRF
ncbi:Aspartic protease, partial [Phytophthora palmivora]